MRHVTIRLSIDPDRCHPFIGETFRDPAVSVEALHRSDALDDGSVVLLVECHGDRDRFESIVAAAESVRECSLTGERTWHAYLSFEPTDYTRSLLATDRSSDIFVKRPIRVIDGPAMEVTYVGHESGFRERLEELPDGVDVEVVGTGSSYPDAAHLLDGLTARQREIFAVAVEQGYYADPRRATHQELADELGCSSATVGEHLRKIEATVLGDLHELDTYADPDAEVGARNPSR
ncbi:helix-turn-helix domain-containing protein [Halorientalis halophila]|uniref:helix-turn-helix domain-containing protein n=1 Tax=Halorientalis halophila TaxID=3108499 RepID=UPI003009A0B0